MIEFTPFTKIFRTEQLVRITEKIDGTNACVIIGADGEFLTAARNGLITPQNDNHGFS